MKVGKLEEIFRSDVDDAAKPYLWSPEEFLAYLNEAEVEAAIRSRLLVDSTTAAICNITVAAATQNFATDPRIFMIRRAKLDADSYPLQLKQLNALDEEYAGWDATDGPGIPAGYYTTGLGSNLISVPLQDVETTLKLTVVREPLVEMNDREESPEIPARYHQKLLDWVKYRAYSKPDSETKNPELAALHYQMFEAEFGPRRSALELQFESEHEGYGMDNGNY